jgi:hypothetical protein
MKRTSNPAVRKIIAKFYYKKPSISYDVSNSYSSINYGRRNTNRAPGLSKTKTVCDISAVEEYKLKANRSVMNPLDSKPVFTKKNSLRVIDYQKIPISNKSQKHPTPQMNKLSPKSLNNIPHSRIGRGVNIVQMNTKSKEILYKTFIKEFKICTETFSKTIPKEELYLIMQNMRYLNINKKNTIPDSDLRHIDYFYRICKGNLANLKLILLCMESFYQFHLQYIARDKSRGERSSMKKGKWLPFAMKQISPDRNNYHSLSYVTMPSSKFSPSWNSPKSSMVKYDNNNQIVEIPEEYEDFLRRKFSRLWMGRKSNNKKNIKNGSIPTNLSSSKNLTYDSMSVSYIGKENHSTACAKDILDQSKADVRKNVLKRLTTVLIEKEHNHYKENNENTISKIKVTHNKPTHRTPQMLSIKNAKDQFNCKMSVKNLFTAYEGKLSNISNKRSKPLISHELGKKLKSHWLVSGEPKATNTIAIDLDSDGEWEEHNNYLDESIDKVELNEKHNVSQSYESGDTALVSATKQLLNQVHKISKPK